MAPLKLYWSSGLKNGRKNFGDWLSPLLVEALSGREVIHAPPNRCDMTAAGSILQRVKHHWWNRPIHVWGSGFIEPGPSLRARHHYHAVRGKETAALIPGANIQALGDPGLLVERLLPSFGSVPKRTSLGLIPHYKDQLDPAVAEFMRRMPEARILNILGEPEDFLRDLATCQFVLSSSLHGLIAADAFRIPNAWIELSDKVRGARFKFRDYYSVFGLTASPLQLPTITHDRIEELAAQYTRPGLRDIQQKLEAAFPFTK